MRPQKGNLLALSNAVGANKCIFCRSILNVTSTLNEPAGYVVQILVVLKSPTSISQILFLFIILHTAPQIWRIPHHIDFFILGVGADRVPVGRTGIAAHDMTAGAQRERIGRGAELLTELVVHLVLRQPEGERGGVAGVFVYLDVVELREGEVAEREHWGTKFHKALPNFDFQFTETLVGDDEEVAGAAGRIKELNLTHPHQQGVEGFGIIAGTQEFGGEVVQEEGLDNLHNVGHGGIVNAQLGTVFRGDDGLGHRAEDVGVDFAPLVFPALDHQEPSAAAEDRDGIALEEETTVDVGKVCNDFVGLLLPEALVIRGHYDKETVDEIG